MTVILRRFALFFLSVLLISAVFAGSFASASALYVYAAEPNAEQSSFTEATAAEAVISSSDSAYFDRVSVIPMNVEIPEFYQQVTTIAGMYIFTTPDGSIYKRIYGSLNGQFGWYIPEGAANVVPADAMPVNINDDIKLYQDAVKAYASVTQASSYVGILPPEHGTYGMRTVFGSPIEKLLFGSVVLVLLLCFFIIVLRSLKSKKPRHTVK